jgi:ribonuclease R
MVTVEITRWPTPTRGPAGRIIEVLGDINDPGVDTEIILRKHGIQDEHGHEAIAEAKRIGTAVKERDIAGRTDFRDRKVVTIDGETARDFDDAISIETLKNGNATGSASTSQTSPITCRRAAPRPGGLRARHLGLFSGTRGAHVPVGTVDRRLCSLNPHVDRLVQSCLWSDAAGGDVVRYEMHDGAFAATRA